MGFYVMRQDTSIEGSAAVVGLPDSMDALEWMQGQGAALAPGTQLTLELAPGSGDYRGHLLEGIATLFHEDLKDALDGQGVDNVIYSPVRLRDPNDGTTEGGYFLARITSLLDCVDTQRSKVRPWVTGIGFDFLSMAIDASRTGGARIFRLKDDPARIIINEELKRYFDETDMLVGVDLIETGKYSDW
jgi:hypothetical protein